LRELRHPQHEQDQPVTENQLNEIAGERARSETSREYGTAILLRSWTSL
jgi:hypothetical protein